MKNPFRTSLEVKILVLVVAVLSAGFGIFAVFDVSRDAKALRKQKEDLSSVVSSEVVGSIQNTMLTVTDKQSGAVGALENLRRVPEVDRIQIFSNQGVEVFSGDAAPVSGGSEVMDVLSGGGERQFYQDVGGRKYLVDVRPLPNDAACQECHGSASSLRGAVLVSTPMADVQAAINAKIVRISTVFAGGLVVLLVVLGVALRIAILGPLRRMVGVIGNIAGGDLDQRVELTSEDEVGDLAQSFNRMTDSLQATQNDLRQVNLNLLEANRLKTEFLSVMSHELRTPLNAIIGFSEVLKDYDGGLDERQNKYVVNIETSGRNLLQLINDILDLAHVSSDHLELDMEVLSISQIMEDIFKLGHSFAAQRRIWLDMIPSGPLPLVIGDEAKIKRILYNLVSNAIKFTPEGGRVTISARAPGGSVEISVQDTGIGISKDDQQKIFSMFEQLESADNRKYEGTGVGLALSRKLAELHGGEIRVESELGRGSTFTLSLPTAPGSPLEIRQDATEPSGSEEETAVDADPGRPVVLVAEDDPQTRELLSLWLNESSYRVEHAVDGEQALQLAEEIRPYAIILDILLPKVDGWQVLEQLKRNPATNNTPVIIISILERRQRALEMGAFDYFVKPVGKKELLCSLESRRLHDLKGNRLLDGEEENPRG